MIIDNTVPIPKISTDPAIQKLMADLQGNILKSHAKPHVKLLFLEFSGSVDAVKDWIGNQLEPIIIPMVDQLKDHEANKHERVVVELNFCSFSLTKMGYDFLEIDKQPEDESFKGGMGSGTIKCDPPKSDWETKYNTGIHALLILAHNDPKSLTAFYTNIKMGLAPVAIIVAEEDGQALENEKEHFGFADGRSQPRFFEDDLIKEGPVNLWNPFASLNLALTKDPNGRAFNGGITGEGDFPVDDLSGTHSYGSYLVFRKLEQDVPGWNKAVVQLAQNLNLPPDLVGAYAVGRFQDGTPVLTHTISQGTIPIENNFDYAGDMAGAKCPFHSHIRKSNPRGDTTRQFGVPLEAEKQRRIARRGIPYTEEDGKGLLFMCYQSNIVDQFDFIQNSWVDNDGFLSPDTGIDDTIGQCIENPKTWPTGDGQTLNPNKFKFGQFVLMKGGEYFFTPSISFLKTFKTLSNKNSFQNQSNPMSTIIFTDGEAFINLQPIQPTPGGTLHVIGIADTQNTNQAKLHKRIPQGINPTILLLELIELDFVPAKNPQKVEYIEGLEDTGQYQSIEIFSGTELVDKIDSIAIVQ